MRTVLTLFGILFCITIAFGETSYCTKAVKDLCAVSDCPIFCFYNEKGNLYDECHKQCKNRACQIAQDSEDKQFEILIENNYLRLERCQRKRPWKHVSTSGWKSMLESITSGKDDTPALKNLVAMYEASHQVVRTPSIPASTCTEYQLCLCRNVECPLFCELEFPSNERCVKECRVKACVTVSEKISPFKEAVKVKPTTNKMQKLFQNIQENNGQRILSCEDQVRDPSALYRDDVDWRELNIPKINMLLNDLNRNPKQQRRDVNNLLTQYEEARKDESYFKRCMSEEQISDIAAEQSGFFTNSAVGVQANTN